MITKPRLVVIFSVCIVALISMGLPSCKGCKKAEPVAEIKADTVAPFTMQPSNTLTMPHADSTVIPLLTAVLDKAFEASSKKDYATLGSLIVYRGPDMAKYGTGVFNTKNAFDKSVVKITAEAINKWSKDVESVEFARAFEMPQPNNRTMNVLEVIFVSPKYVDRKFFGFLEINGEWKIADITSNL